MIKKTALSKTPTKAQAKQIGDKLKVDWNKVKLEQFQKGLKVEQEHSDITRGDPVKTGKIVLAHLKEMKNYYTKLAKIEKKK